MTNNEYIDVIKCNYPPSSYSMLREALDESINLLEKAEKYKWHDLMKNPNDLPPDFHTVEICLEGLEGMTAGICLAMHNKIHGIWGTNFCSYRDSEVSAWREIEPFEVVEE